MIKKISKLKKINLVILIIIAISFISVGSIIVVNIVRDVRARYAIKDNAITYEIHNVNLDVAKTTLTFYDEDGLKQVITPENTINCNDRTTVYVDYYMTDRTYYEFTIIDNNGNIDTVNYYFEIPRAKGEYKLSNGEFVQEPYVGEGFEKANTRYLYLENGALKPGNWISKAEPNNWYNYTDRNWANIYVESNGKEAYNVWIPRYCYKVDETKEERMDVKFINIENEYKYIEGGVEKTIRWDVLQDDGYVIPHAFWWDKNNDGVEDVGEQLAGYWFMKYELAEGSTTTTVNFDITQNGSMICIENIQFNTEITDIYPISSCTVAINGNIVKTIGDITSINYNELKFSGIAEGTNYINVTALNSSGEIVGSMTKKYEYNTTPTEGTD